VVYEVFASEVAYRERRLKDGAGPTEQHRKIRDRLRARMGVSEADYDVWVEIAAQLMASLEANAKQGDSVLKGQNLTSQQRIDTVRGLSAKRGDTIDDAILKWKAHIGIRFRFVDERIRAYVAPGLRISDEPPLGTLQQERHLK
jgi:hypothetical protein